MGDANTGADSILPILCLANLLTPSSQPTVICLRCNHLAVCGCGECYSPSPAPLRRDPTAQSRDQASRTHSPCSQLHARPAKVIAAPAGGLLPHRFNPYHPLRPCPKTRVQLVAGMLSVAVVVGTVSPLLRPHLRFRGATLPF